MYKVTVQRVRVIIVVHSACVVELHVTLN